MMPSPLVHPRMFQRNAKFFPSRAALQEPVDSINAIGERVTSYQTVAGLEAVRCVVADVESKIGDETRVESSTYVKVRSYILLAGYYPQITERWRALIDGTAYDIVSMIQHSHDAMTKLLAQVIR